MNNLDYYGTFGTGDTTFDSTPTTTGSPSTVINTSGKKRKVKATKKNNKRKKQTKKIKNKKIKNKKNIIRRRS